MARITFRNAADVPYDNTTSGLTADDVQEALDEIVAETGIGTLDNNAVVFTNGSGNMTTEAAFAYNSTTNTLTVDSIIPNAATSLNINSSDGFSAMIIPSFASGDPVNMGPFEFNYSDFGSVTFGTGQDARLLYDTVQGNDSLVLELSTPGDATGSGTFLIIDGANSGDDYAPASSAHPMLKIFSNTAAATATDEWISFAHDVTDGRIEVGSGQIASAAAIGSAASTTGVRVMATGTGLAGGSIRVALGGEASGGGHLVGGNNTIVFTLNANRLQNHDHGTQTDPHFYVHSATPPDTDNSQWISLFHDQTNGVIETGSQEPLHVRPSGTTILTLIGRTTGQNAVTVTQPNHTAGTPQILVITGGTNTSLDNASLEEVVFGLNRTVQFDGGVSSSFDHYYGSYFRQPTLTAAASDLTVANASTLVIEGAPDVADGNISATANHALHVLSGNAQFDGGTRHGDNIVLQLGNGPDVAIDWSTAQATANSMIVAVRVGSAAFGGNVILTAYDNRNKDHDHAVATNPTLIGHSASDPDGGNTEFWSLTHNATDAVLTIGTGDLEIVSTQIRQAAGNIMVIARGDGGAWASISNAGDVSLAVTTRFLDDIPLVFGFSSDVRIDYSTTQANDGLVIGTGVGTAAQSGNIIVTALANIEFDHAHAAATNPTLILHSANASTTQWIAFAHSSSHGFVTTGVGDIILNAASTKVRANTGNALVIARQDGTAWATLDSGTGVTQINIGTELLDNVSLFMGSSSDASLFWGTAQTNDGVMFSTGVGTAAQSGNIIITTTANRSADHAYGTTDDPRLFIASATTPATNYISFKHNGTTGIIQTAGGTLTLQPVGVASAVFDNGTTGQTTFALTQRVNTSGSPSLAVFTGAAHTTLDQADLTDIDIDLSRTITFTGGVATVDNYEGVLIQAPTLDASSGGPLTVTNATTFKITGAPIDAGANIVLENPYSFWVDSGDTRLDGDLLVNTIQPQSGSSLVLNEDGGAAALTIGTSGQVNVGSSTLATALGDFSAGVTSSGQFTFIESTATATVYNSSGTATHVFDTEGESVFNTNGADIDFRVEGDTLPYMIFTSATASTENIALLTLSEPDWQSMDRGYFLGDTSTTPTGNPTAGIFVWSEAGVGKARAGSGTVTTWAPAEPHCKTCTRDFALEWENDGTTLGMLKSKLSICVWCLVTAVEASGIDLECAVICKSGS